MSAIFVLRFGPSFAEFLAGVVKVVSRFLGAALQLLRRAVRFAARLTSGGAIRGSPGSRLQEVRPSPSKTEAARQKVRIYVLEKTLLQVLFHLSLGESAVAPIDFLLFFAYAEDVSSTCQVSFEDGAGVRHTVSVSASSLYEAAALAIVEFKRNGFAIATVGPATRLSVAVEPPSTVHELPVAKLRAWLDSSGKTPREQAKKVTLRQMLERA